jgi:predicted nucleic acid-binding protein
MIVSNATPLLALTHIDTLELLAHIVQHILIPETVWHEVTRGPWRPGAEAIRDVSWVEVHPVATIPPEILSLATFLPPVIYCH